MEIVLWVIAFVLIIIGISGVLLPALPGVPVAFVGFLLGAWIDKFQKVGWLAILILAFMMVLSMSLDFLTTLFGAKKMGASSLAAMGAMAGTVVGLFFGIAGIFIGPFVGAALGEFFAKRDLMQAGKVGIGTWIGIIVGTALKLALVFLMLGVFVTAYFF